MNKLVKLLATRALLMNTSPRLKLLGTFTALVAITLLFVSFKTPGVSAGPESERDQIDQNINLVLPDLPRRGRYLRLPKGTPTSNQRA